MAKTSKRPENWWCIASGRVLLPFTARATRAQALKDYESLSPVERVVKVIVGRASEGSWCPNGSITLRRLPLSSTEGRDA